MANIKIEVAKIRGHCNATLEIGDTFILQGLEIMPCNNAKTCQVAWIAIVNNAGRLRLNARSIYVACPDPGTGEGGNAIFKLSRIKENAAHQS